MELEARTVKAMIQRVLQNKLSGTLNYTQNSIWRTEELFQEFVTPWTNQRINCFNARANMSVNIRPVFLQWQQLEFSPSLHLLVLTDLWSRTHVLQFSQQHWSLLTSCIMPQSWSTQSSNPTPKHHHFSAPPPLACYQELSTCCYLTSYSKDPITSCRLLAYS